MTIDKAGQGDLAQIRDIQIASWQVAYRGMVADAFLSDEVPSIMARKWAALPGEDWIVLVDRAGGEVRGFTALDLGHEGGPYVDNLHVRPDLRGGGIGTRLLAAMAGEVMARGGREIWLTVINENAPTRAFYRAMGGRESAPFEDDLFGQKIVGRSVRWTDLPALAARMPA